MQSSDSHWSDLVRLDIDACLIPVYVVSQVGTGLDVYIYSTPVILIVRDRCKLNAPSPVMRHPRPWQEWVEM